MPKFPVDAPKKRVMRALEQLGFRLVREREHIAMVRENSDGTRISIDHAESSSHQGIDFAHHLYAIGYFP